MNSEQALRRPVARGGSDRVAHEILHAPGLGLRRVLLFGLVLLTTLAGTFTMLLVLRSGGIGLAGWLVLPLFAATFAWISMAFWTAAAGFLMGALRLDPGSLRSTEHGAPADPGRPLTGRTALVVPIYNEEAERVVLGVEATCQSVLDTGQGQQFELYLLSDSDDARIIPDEERAVRGLRRRLAGRLRVHYRRRTRNEGRKAGNIADFCRRWGAGYAFMVVLDADSLMDGHTLVRLVQRMEANPGTGLIQTLPMPVRQETLFGRFQQFAHALHGPMLAEGLAFWQGDTANYWGHNAILRVRPFMEHCNLPTLPGRAPLGGEILSHDFVEAAFLRRAGWAVWLQPDLTGSYEELPANLMDYAKRDRRWSQGNLQHLKLLAAPGLHPLSRLHFLLGASAYLASLFWLLMLAAATVAVIGFPMGPERAHTSFVSTAHSPIAYALLAGTLGLLLVPRFLGIGLALQRRSREFGGAGPLLTSGVLETLYSVLLAPLMMAFHSQFIAAVLVGRDVKWTAQARVGRALSWRETWQRTGGFFAAGVGWGALVLLWAPDFLWWVLPVLGGLVLGPWLARSSGSRAAGLALRRWGLLQTPSEAHPAGVLHTLEAFERAARQRAGLNESPVDLARWSRGHGRSSAQPCESEIPEMRRAAGEN
jgi:membrane glycosyltransferase